VVQEYRATKFYSTVHNICVPSAWKLPHVALLVHTIFGWWSVDFWKICVPLAQVMGR